MPSTRLLTVSCALLFVALAGCATTEILQPKMAVPVDATNLSGQWVINELEGQNQDAVYAAIRANSKGSARTPFEEAQIRARNTSRNQPGSRPRKTLILGRAGGAIVHAFLKTADKLKITQTDSALFISFNRSIVQEYTFAENRTITLGEVQAARVSGWTGNDYVIETLDKDREKLTEQYSLSADRQKLYREIILRDDKMQEVAIAHVYDRASD